MSSNRMSRREFLRWSAAAAGAMGLTACGLGQTPVTRAADSGVTGLDSVTSRAPSPAMAEIEYFIYDLGPANKAREDAIAAFQSANPDVTVKLTVLPYGENWQKLAALVAAGTPPDVVYGDFSMLRFVLEGQALDLTPYFDADAVLNQAELFSMDLRDPIQAKLGTERIYNLIMGTWVPILYFNTEMFDAAGEPYPTEEWTWAEIRATAKRLTKSDEGKWGFQFGHMLDNTGWLWWGHNPEDYWAVPQFIPDKTQWNSQAGLGVMSIIHSMGAAGDNCAVPPAEVGSYPNYAGAFGAGMAAMYTGGDWDAGWSFRDLPFKWDMTFTPKVLADYRPALNTMVSSNCIMAGTGHPDQAWAFIRFLTATEEGQLIIGQGAYETPVLNSVAQSDAVIKPEWAVPGYATRLKAAELPGPMRTPYPLCLNVYEFHDRHIAPIAEQLLNGEIDPQAAVEYLDAEGTPYFAQLKTETPAVK